MKKPLRYMLSVVLMLALMLSMGTAAFADNTDSKPPIEYVSYGIGLPDEPGVEKHGLGDNDITIDGVSWKPKTSDDKLYVHILDLAAAKLLRGCAGEAKELGLDYAKLYIENGLIQVKEGIPSAEAAELKGKLDKLTYAAVIGVVAGDVFDVGNGGDVKLQVVVAGFVTGDGGASSPAAAQGTGKSGLDVKGVGFPFDGFEYDSYGREIPTYDMSNLTSDTFGGVTTTTIYIVYGGVTRYGSSGGGGSVCYDLDNETPPQEEIPGYRSGDGRVGIAKAAGDSNDYWIKVVGIGEEQFIHLDDLSNFDINDDLDKWLAGIVDYGDDGSKNFADKVIVATDKDGKDVVMTIDLKDKTAAPDEIYDDEGLKDEAPDGYETEYKDDYEAQYEPEEIVDVDQKPGADTAEVEVRDTVVADNYQDGGEIDIS